MDGSEELKRRLDAVHERIELAERRAGRAPGEVEIVAVTKTVDREIVDRAIKLGVRHFAENRVQVARDKFQSPLPSGVSLSLVGQLQSNKVRPAFRLFDQIESVDRASLISALEREADRVGHSASLLLQVNVAREPQKSGCDPTEVDELANAIHNSPHLHLRGLMTIAPLCDDPRELRPIFRWMKNCHDRLAPRAPDDRFNVLSMGMTNDFEVAIEEGATHVRIGRAIFGPSITGLESP